MPGRLRSSFRSGNLAEHLGILLLKGIAAVAEVSRPEDVGLDAIGTLLRRDDDGNCYAEDTFVVQLKSASTKSIEYNDHELEWLLGQSQPMFIGLVDMAQSRISLFSTIYVDQAIWALEDVPKVDLRFGKSKLPGILGTCRQWAGGKEGARVWLGAPILEWSLSDLTNRAWESKTYAILKKFLAVVRGERELLSLKQVTDLDWTTNDYESIRTGASMQKGHPDELGRLAHRAVPVLRALMMRSNPWPSKDANPEDVALLSALLTLNAELRRHGADADPHNMFAVLLADCMKAANENKQAREDHN